MRKRKTDLEIDLQIVSLCWGMNRTIQGIAQIMKSNWKTVEAHVKSLRSDGVLEVVYLDGHEAGYKVKQIIKEIVFSAYSGRVVDMKDYLINIPDKYPIREEKKE